MNLFNKHQILFLKNSDRDTNYLEQLEELYSSSTGDTRKAIEKEISIIKAGIIGENNVIFELENSGMNMIVLHDLFIETEEGHSAQIDFMVICSKLIFIIECKNLFGNIEINNKGDFIRTIQYGGRYYKEGIYSPITQNTRHLEVLKEKKNNNHASVINLLSDMMFSNFYKSLIVLANPKTVLNDKFAKKEIKQQVYRADQLIQVIKSENSRSNMPKSSFKEMKELGEGWLSNCSEHADNRIDKFIEAIQNDKQSSKNSSVSATEENLCPRCGHPLVKRIARRGVNQGKEFLGCSNYPHCRYIENIESN